MSIKFQFFCGSTLLFVLHNKEAKLLPPGAFVSRKGKNAFWRGLCPRSHWGGYSTPPDPLAGSKGDPYMSLLEHLANWPTQQSHGLFATGKLLVKNAKMTTMDAFFADCKVIELENESEDEFRRRHSSGASVSQRLLSCFYCSQRFQYRWAGSDEIRPLAEGGSTPLPATERPVLLSNKNVRCF